jgi:hypothetical protein
LLRKEHSLRVAKNRMMGKILGRRVEVVTRVLKKILGLTVRVVNRVLRKISCLRVRVVNRVLGKILGLGIEVVNRVLRMMLGLRVGVVKRVLRKILGLRGCNRRLKNCHNKMLPTKYFWGRGGGGSNQTWHERVCDTHGEEVSTGF